MDIVLMDDTVLVSTTCRPGMMRKVSLLQDYCTKYDMKVRSFFVISGSEEDCEPLVHGGRLGGGAL